MSLINAAIDRSRMVMSTLILILVVGLVAYNTIPKESDPDIDIPQVYVSVHLEGISPEDSERLLLRPLEQELSGIEGMKEMKSTGYQGGGNIILEFQNGFNKDEAMDDVQKAVDRARPELPDDVDEPTVNEINFSLFPVLVVTLSGDLSERTLIRLAQDLQDKVEALPQVLEAGIAGDREELVEIIVDPMLLESYNIRGEQVIDFFNRSNRLVAAGNLDTGVGRFAIKVPGLFETVDDILDMPIVTNEDSVIRVRDIAEIRRTFKDAESFARINGERAIALSIVKRTGENIIETIEGVRGIVTHEQEFWPEGVEVNYTLDRSTDIRNMLTDLQNNMISAVLLVMIVIIAALGLRSAILVGIAIPGAFLSGILILAGMGLTINIVVLFSLILSVGMLVDGAIVVTEYADRKMSEGMSRKDAYARASNRMAWPIIASTATTLAAFAPLLFWPGTPGEFMRYMPITLIGVLASSLAMALIFVPTLGALIGKAPKRKQTADAQALAADGDTVPDLSKIGGYVGLYLNVLRGALKHPAKILMMALVMLVVVQIVYGKFGKGVEFFPEIEPEYATVLIHARGNLSVYEKDALIRQVEARILDDEGVDIFYTEIGKPSGQNGGGEVAEDVIGQIQLELTEWDERRKAEEIFNEIRSETEDIGGISIEIQKQQGGPPTGKAVQIEIGSVHPELLPDAVDLVYEAFDEIGDFIDVEDSLPLPGIEWELQVDRAQASKFGVDVSLIGFYVRMVTNGLIAATYRPNDSDDEIDIVLRYPEEQRTLNALDSIKIETAEGSIPLNNFVTRVPKQQTGTINRVDQQRVITVKADLPQGINIDSKVTAIKDWLAENKDRINPQISFNFRGEDEEMKESMTFLMQAFLVALFIMGIILVTQFNSFYNAALILSAVIMSTIGVFIGLLLTGQPFGVIMSGVGVIALAGIIVNNNIVLIDTFDTLHNKKGMPARDAIMLTGAQRLRPVLLTTITTVLGLLPMMLQMNIDFITREVTVGAPSTQFWVQLSTAIGFGLTFSTVLTLIVTPSALMVKENWTQFRNRRKEKKAEKNKTVMTEEQSA